MTPIKITGVDATIKDMFLGIESLLQEGQSGRYEMKALPQNQLSALGTQMFCTIQFGQGFPVGEGLRLDFQYEGTDKVEKVGVDRTPQKYSETFGFRPPYFYPQIKTMGDHVLVVKVYRKSKFAGVITKMDYVGDTYIPYKVVPPAQE